VHAHRNGLKTALLLGLLSGLILFFGAQLGGSGGLLIALVVALGVNGYSYFYSDKLALRSMRAYPISQVQHPAALRHRRRAGQLDADADAAALPQPDQRPERLRDRPQPPERRVCCTEGILQLLDERELRGVLGHELAHVGNRDILISSVAAALATVITFLANMAQFAMIFGGRDREGGNVLSSLLLIVLGPLAAGVIQMAISRNREYAADLTGARSRRPAGAGQRAAQARARHRARPLVEDPSLAPTSSLMIAEPVPRRRHRQAVQHPPADGRADRPARVDGRLPPLTAAQASAVVGELQGEVELLALQQRDHRLQVVLLLGRHPQLVALDLRLHALGALVADELADLLGVVLLMPSLTERSGGTPCPTAAARRRPAS
jgi:heat shock protein HtpX